MIKKIRVSLVDFCDKNDLTIVLTSIYDTTTANIQAGNTDGVTVDVCELEEYERQALIELARRVSGKIIMISGKGYVFPRVI